MILAGKIIFLMLGVAYSVPVIVGGAIHKARVTDAQTWCFAIGWVGFATLQWLI